LKLVLDAVCSQIPLGRRLFEVGVERGFYAKVSRLGEQWFELDLHFLSLGGGEIALGWWFEECLVPYLNDTDKLNSVKSISIVTGYGKTRTRGRRNGDDGMRKRCRAMLRFMGITEQEQPNLGRIHIDKDSLIELVKKNGGRIIFDLDGYLQWKEEETRANAPPDVEQKIRARFKPTVAGSGGPPFTRVESEYTSDEYRLENHEARLAKLRAQDLLNDNELNGDAEYGARVSDTFQRRPEVSVGRVGTGRDVVGRGISGEGRDFHLGGPHSIIRRTNNDDTGVYDNDASYGVVDRGRPFHQSSDTGFHRTTHSINNRISEQRLSGPDFGEDMGNKVNGSRRFDQIHEYEQHPDERLGHRSRPRDHPYDIQDVARFQGDFGIIQTHHTVANNVNLQRQRIDDYGEQLTDSRDFRVENRGTEHKHYRQDEFNFMDARQQPRDEFRSNSLDRGFQGSRESWRQGDNAQMLEMGRGRADEQLQIERNSFSYDQRINHRREDESEYRDSSNPQNQQFAGSASNFEGDNSMQPYRDQIVRITEQETLRKRQHNEASSQARPLDAQGDRLPVSNNGRGYALEPETQRRRLS
jgi:hypothetical protein